MKALRQAKLAQKLLHLLVFLLNLGKLALDDVLEVGFEFLYEHSNLGRHNVSQLFVELRSLA